MHALIVCIGLIASASLRRVQPPGAKGKRVNIPDPVCWKFPSQKGQSGNANELGDDGGSSWKSSLFFVRSVFPGKRLSRDRDVAPVKHCGFCSVRCTLVVP